MFTNTDPVLNSSTGTMESDWAGIEGDTLYFTISKDPLTGWDGRTWTGIIKLLATDDDPASTFDVTDSTTSSAVSVYFQWSSSSLDVGKYLYYIKWHDPDGDITETTLMGKISIKAG